MRFVQGHDRRVAEDGRPCGGLGLAGSEQLPFALRASANASIGGENRGFPSRASILTAYKSPSHPAIPVILLGTP